MSAITNFLKICSVPTLFKGGLGGVIALIMFCFLSLSLFTPLYSQGLQYEMVSYTENNKDASTPLLSLAFFNKKYFTINYQSFTNAFQFMFDLMIGISIATAVVVFMIGAFEGIINRNVTKEKIDAKDRMTRAIVGLMIILSTWLIINTINPDLLRLPIFSDLDKLKTSAGTGSTGSTNVYGGAF